MKPTVKPCIVCGDEFTLTNGRQTMCPLPKDCRAKRKREHCRAYYADNSEKVYATSKAWRKAHPENRREEGQRYRVANRDKNNARGREYYAANREEVNNKHKKYREENLDKTKERNRVYREENEARIKEHDRDRGQTPHRKESQRLAAIDGYWRDHNKTVYAARERRANANVRLYSELAMLGGFQELTDAAQAAIDKNEGVAD